MRLLNKRKIKIFITFFVIYLIFIHWPGWNEFSHLALTMAIVDEGRLEIDSYYNQTGDRAYYNGHYYSDKAPGLSFLAVPVYATWKFIYYNFITNFISHQESEEYVSKIIDNEPIFLYINPSLFFLLLMIFVTVFTSSLFGALLVVLIYKISKYFTKNERYRLLLTIVAGFGSLILPYSTVFESEIIATFFVFLSFFLLFKIKKERIRDSKVFFLAGFFSTFSIVMNYPTIVLAFALLIYLFTFKLRNKKLIFIYLLGIFLGISPLLIYNYVIFKNPFELTLQHNDPLIWKIGEEELKRYGITSFIPNLFVTLRITLYPYRGLFFYFPILFLSLVGFYWMSKKYKKEVIMILIPFIVLLYFISTRYFWWGGFSFGPRYLIYIIPFFFIPLIYSFKKIPKTIWLPVLLLTLILSSFSITQWEDELLDPSTVKMREKYEEGIDSFEILRNPISEHYIPIFLKNGLRSRIFEELLYDPYKIDIRDFHQIRVREVKLFTLIPFGILVLKIPFLIISIFLLIITLIWRKKLFRTFIFKKISVGLFFSILIVLLFISRLGFKDVVYYKNWHPIYVNATHMIEENWISERASIFFYSPKEEKTNLLLEIGTFYKPRQLIIEFNNQTYEYLVSSFNQTIITPSVSLKEGENVIDLKSQSGCDKPALLINGSKDNRCLSFMVNDFSIISHLPEYKVIFGKNWYPPDINITWAYENSTVLVQSTQKLKAKLNLTLKSYYKPREIDFYLNDILLDTFTIEPYKMNMLTQTFSLKEGENVIEFITKEKCDVPAIIEKGNDIRCLSFGLIDADLISIDELIDKNKIVFGKNWYEQEKDGRWMSNDGVIYIFSQKETDVILNISIFSYFSKTANIYLNDKLMGSYRVASSILEPITLRSGENILYLNSKEECDRLKNENSSDIRCLSFKIKNIEIIKKDDFKESFYYGSNWYPLENVTDGTFRFMSQDATILLLPYPERIKLNISIDTYKKSRKLDLYLNDELIDSYLINSFFSSVLTPEVKLNRDINIVKFHSKEGCDIPLKTENSTDLRCLSFAIKKITKLTVEGLIEENKTLVFGKNWYEQEKDGRWMKNNANIFLFSKEEKEINLILDVMSYYKKRKIDLYANKVLILSETIPPYKSQIIIQGLKLIEGENLIEFKSRKDCNIPNIIESTGDKRCLSLKLLDLKIVDKL